MLKIAIEVLCCTVCRLLLILLLTLQDSTLLNKFFILINKSCLLCDIICSPVMISQFVIGAIIFPGYMEGPDPIYPGILICKRLNLQIIMISTIYNCISITCSQENDFFKFLVCLNILHVR